MEQLPRHTFQSGAWAEVIPVADLRTRHHDLMNEVANEDTPLNDDGATDWAKIDAQPGGRRRWSLRWVRHRRNAVLAMILTGWSYDLPLPQINAEGDFLNEESIGETDPELANLADPYVEALTREPDPKEATTSG